MQNIRKSFFMLLLPLLAGTEAYAQGPPPTAVGVSPVVERDIPPAIRLVGTVYADRSAIVASEVAGLVAAFPVREGQFLRQGEPLCHLDEEVARLRLDEARAVLESLKAQLAEAENGERREDIARLEAFAMEAGAMLEKAEFERNRVTRLFETGQTSEKEKYDADREFIAARGRRAAADAELEKARNGTRPEVLARWRQQVASQQAQTHLLERVLRQTTIRAPFDGFVVSRNTEIGEWLAEGGAVVEMVAVETVRVRADAPESVIPFANAGQPATVEVEALREQFAGQISRVIPRANPMARTFPIEIDLPNTDHRLLPGMFVWAFVPSGPVGKRLMAPKDAIVTRGAAKELFVIRSAGDANMAIPMQITTGLESGGLIEVRVDGLAPGDMVVCRGNERLFGPTPVLPTPLESGSSASGAADNRSSPVAGGAK